MRIIVCGDRNWTDYTTIFNTLKNYDSQTTTIIHGNCRGADILAAVAGKILGMKIESYPADWSIGPRAGPIRNKRMLNEGKPDLVIAFHAHIEISKGTKHMLKIAQQHNVETLLIK